MFDKIIAYSVRNKFMVGLFMAALTIWGIFSIRQLPIDAVPDITNNQVQIITISPTLATQEIEQFITTPVELALQNLQQVEEIRSTSRFGLSTITVVFEEGYDIYLARQLVGERIKAAQEAIPNGLGVPEMTPISTGLGEIYQYVIRPEEGFEDKYSPMKLRTIQDWIVKRQLLGIEGVAEINSMGGYLKQYEVAINPSVLKSTGISISEVFLALEKSNENTGGAYIEKNSNAYYIRSEGIAKSIDDIGNVVIKNNNNIPVLIKDIASVKLGKAPRYGALVRNGEEAVGEGIIEGTKKYVEGDYIKKGEVIAYVANTSFILKQQEYLEAKAGLKLKEFNLERQQSLVNANAGVSKSLQNSQAEVDILRARTNALAKQLKYLGISVEKLSPNTLSERIPIVAPMSGYISSINMHNGIYAIPSNAIMQIISSDHLHLELDVFEKDIAAVKVGQKISYTVPALGNTIYTGEISVIGKEFNMATKTVRVHGHLEGKKPTFLKDLFINAKIWLTDSKSNAVPEGAIIKDGNETFIYAAKKEEKETEFTKIRVIAGATNNGFTAVKLLDKIPKGMQVVTKGAYYVNAQSKAGELEHED